MLRRIKCYVMISLVTDKRHAKSSLKTEQKAKRNK